MKFVGVSIEVRICAEEPLRNFQPSSGTLTEVRFPDNARVDTWVELGTEVLPYFDPLLAKIIVHGRDRAHAIELLKEALDVTKLAGISTNLEYLKAIVANKNYQIGSVSTRFLDNFTFRPPIIEILEPGMFTTIQVTQNNHNQPNSRITPGVSAIGTSESHHLALWMTGRFV